MAQLTYSLSISFSEGMKERRVQTTSGRVYGFLGLRVTSRAATPPGLVPGTPYAIVDEITCRKHRVGRRQLRRVVTARHPHRIIWDVMAGAKEGG
jgi:hypothetical protein